MSWVLWAQIMFIMFWAAILTSGIISSAQSRKAAGQVAIAKAIHAAHSGPVEGEGMWDGR